MSKLIIRVVIEKVIEDPMDIKKIAELEKETLCIESFLEFILMDDNPNIKIEVTGVE